MRYEALNGCFSVLYDTSDTPDQREQAFSVLSHLCIDPTTDIKFLPSGAGLEVTLSAGVKPTSALVAVEQAISCERVS